MPETHPGRPNPRIAVPPEVVAAGPTPPPVRNRVVPPSGGGRSPVPLPFVMVGLAALIGGFIYFIGRDQGTEVEAADGSPSLEVLEESAPRPESESTVPVVVEPTASENTVTTTATTAPATTAPATTAPSTTAPATTAPATTAPVTTAPATTAPEAETQEVVAIDSTGPPVRDTGTVRHAVFSGGLVYLRGAVPTEQFGKQVQAAAEKVVGPGNVINQYEIDPAAEAAGSAPLYVADTVLFPSGGTQINPAFFPILDLGSKLMQVNDAVQIDVIAHTDSIGSEALNTSISQSRADTVRQYWLDQGFDPSRIKAVGMGESEPIATNQNSEGRQANRRAEFIVIGILG